MTTQSFADPLEASKMEEAIAKAVVWLLRHGASEPVKSTVFLLTGRLIIGGCDVCVAYQLSYPHSFYRSGNPVQSEVFKAFELEFVKVEPDGLPLFREPEESDARLVAIKRVRRWFRNSLFSSRCYFDALNDIEAKRCTSGRVDALQDGKYVYAIYPYLRQGTRP